MRVFQIQRFTAIALVVFMTIHMVVVHYPPFHIDFSRIIDRMAQPVWKGIDIAFLFFVLTHAVTGTYAVLMDFEKINTHKRIIIGLTIAVTVAAFFYGTWTILAFQPQEVTAVVPG